MKEYITLAQRSTFTMDDVASLAGNRSTAASQVSRLMKHGLVAKIRNNLYTCINAVDGQPVASKYQIGSAITESSYISHHSALSFMGLTGQVFYEVYVSTPRRFNDFAFDGITYRCVASKLTEGVVAPPYTRDIKTTTLERTVIDSIKDVERIAGLEELLTALSSIRSLDEAELIRFLDAYAIQFLFQKTAFLLSHYQDSLSLSPSFFAYCRARMGKSTRYLTKGSTQYASSWQLVVPPNLFALSNQGGGFYA